MQAYLSGTPVKSDPMNEQAERVRQLLVARGVKERSLKPELARVCDISYQSVKGWFDGSTKTITAHNLAKIASRWDASLEWLTTGRGQMDSVAALFEEGATYQINNGVREVPVVGKAELGPEGFWAETEHPVGNGDGFVSWPTTDPNAYAVEANGDSMAPRIKHKEFIIVEPNAEILPGDEVLLKTREEPPRCMVKVYQYTRDGRHHLANINTEYEDFKLDVELVEKMHLVVGHAKRSMHRHE